MHINREFLKFPVLRTNKLDVSEMESNYGLILPPVFKVYLENFDPKLYSNRLIYSKVDGLIPFLEPIVPIESKEVYESSDNPYCIEELFSVEQLFEFDKKCKNLYEGMIQIAMHSIGGGFLLGIEAQNLDKIFFQSDSADVEFIGDNIFALLHKIEFVYKNDFIPNVDLDRIYKNVGESFFRIIDDHPL